MFITLLTVCEESNENDIFSIARVMQAFAHHSSSIWCQLSTHTEFICCCLVTVHTSEFKAIDSKRVDHLQKYTNEKKQ